ncbi:MAG TPA: class I SAM-dependent methyltransferase [Verrucomicrobiae bacterium]|nr:class I SAM-dependent methyltransferase [Verrucomicrobiae bacterium]
MSQTCRICLAKGGRATFVFRERMFGWGDEFAYFQCRHCGCLQIMDVPADLARYYPPIYYSFHLQPVPQHGWKPFLMGLRDRAVTTRRGWFGWLLSRRYPARVDVEGLGQVPLREEMRILDVGCGRGQLLSILRRAGFRHLLGVDPHVPGDVEVVPGVQVLKGHLSDVSQQFDLIMLHHVIEHVEDGRGMLAECRERLAPGGRVLLRFPTVECEAWDRYREYWVALDAPRHLVLHTRKSLEALARQAGLRVVGWQCDSVGFQFCASELYRKGLPLTNPDGTPAALDALFSRAQLKQFEREAKGLNAANRGDQVVVLLRSQRDSEASVALE